MALRAMFSQMSGDVILKEAGMVPLGAEKSHLDTQCGESTIIKLLLQEDNNHYSIDQLSMIGQVINQKWIMPSTSCLPFKFYEGDSIFNMLLFLICYYTFLRRCLSLKMESRYADIAHFLDGIFLQCN